MQTQKINRSDPEKVFVACHNVEASATIEFGEPIAFAADATVPGSDVNKLSTSGAAKATTLFAGLAQRQMAAGGYGLVQCFGACDLAIHYLVRTKASNSSSVASTTFAAGNIMALNTVGNGLEISGTAGQSAYLPAVVLLASKSVASATQASGTDNQSITQNVTQSVFVRAM